MALVPTSEVWQHGLLPLHGARVSEQSLLKMLELVHVSSADLSIGIEQWVGLAHSALGLQREQAAACMRLAHILAPPAGTPQPMPRDEALRVPLGSLLLLLWVQWAQHSIGQGLTMSNLKSQVAMGDVWPSLLLPPAAATSANVVDGGVRPNARTLAVHARLQTPLARQRRHVLQVCPDPNHRPDEQPRARSHGTSHSRR